MPLVTAAEVRAAAVPEHSGTGTDSILGDCIADAQSAIADYLRYPVPSGQTEPTLESASYVCYLRGGAEDPRWLWLPFGGGRCTSITSIYDDPERDFAADSLVASSDYTLLAEEGAVMLSSSSSQGQWSTAPRTIKATITAGWASGSVTPPAMKRAICLMAGHLFRLRFEHGHDTVSSQGGNVGIRSEDIPDSVRRLVGSWMLFEALP